MTCRIYVGNLPMDIVRREIEDLFYKYGSIVKIDVKIPNRPPAFAFVEFRDAIDADAACRGRDGYRFAGGYLRVELCRSQRRSFAHNNERREGNNGRNNTRGPPQRTEFRVLISNLPPKASWQDLKDHMRKAGTVCYVTVDGRGGGTVEYMTNEGMERAIKDLDDSEFRGRYDSSNVRVRKEENDTRNDRSQSPRGNASEASRERSRSRSRSEHQDDTTEETIQASASIRSPHPAPKEMIVPSNATFPTNEKTEMPSDNTQSTTDVQSEEDLGNTNAGAEPGDDNEMETPEMESTKMKSISESPSSLEAEATKKDVPEEVEDIDWSKMKVVELREELKKRSLDTNGKKAQLISRLKKAVSA